MSDFTCQASVYVPEWDSEDACDRPATGYVWDVECGGDWPACTQHRDRNTGIRADLVDLLARRPDLRDVGIAGYLAGNAVEMAGAAKSPETWLEVEPQPGGYIGYYLVYPRWRRWLIQREVAA